MKTRRNFWCCPQQPLGTLPSISPVSPRKLVPYHKFNKQMNNEGCPAFTSTLITRHNHRTLSEQRRSVKTGQAFTTLNPKPQSCRHHHANEVPGS